MIRPLNSLLLALACIAFGGCGEHYVTPAAGTDFAALIDPGVDADVGRHFRSQPASPFPANIAVVRVQDYGYGNGRYKTITTRDIESEADYEKLAQLPLVRDVATIGNVLAPPNAASIRDLRTPAAMLHADLLLVYSVDTVFTVEGKSLGPLELITLGLIPNKKAHVTATVAGVLVDVRTGYIYGTTEATANKAQRATVWSSRYAIEKSRKLAEKVAFGDFVDGFAGLWKGVVDTHAASAIPSAISKLAPTPVAVDRDTHYRIRLSD